MPVTGVLPDGAPQPPSATRTAPVALVMMPFGGVSSPSLALSLLAAELDRVGISSDIHYLNLAFAERIGSARYQRYALDLSQAYLGEWLFADCLFPRPQEEAERFVEEVMIPLRRFTLDDIERCEQDRLHARPFLDESLRAVDWTRYRAIGFTSTFQQNTAALAFARMLKEVSPQSVIIFGGANCEGKMGLQMWKSFPWIDYVCTGEGDDVFPELVGQILGSKPRAPLPGIVGGSREEPFSPAVPAKMVMDLDRLPFPDFAAYFDRVERSPIRGDLRLRLLMETSRGCWWGEKHHCTFCGLNGLTMRFRSKSPERALREIRHMAAEYAPRLGPTPEFSMTDNILDLNYFRTVLPALRDAGIGVSLFYETKANLNKEQIRLLAEAGVRDIQPGIESLHSDLLKLMRKGCTALQNIQLLRWCQEYRIIPWWSNLFGFPGEDPRWFVEQAVTIRRIQHLDPPGAVCPVRLDRFSPHFEEAGSFGISCVRPARALSHIYALSTEELNEMAYYFEFDFADGRDPARYIEPLLDATDDWRVMRPDAFLYAITVAEDLVLWDGRAAGPGRLHVLRACRKTLYEFCDRIRGREEVIHHAQRVAGMTEEEATLMLEDWKAAGLVLEDQGCILALAVALRGAPAANRGTAAGATGDQPRDANGSPDGLARLRPRPRATALVRELGDGLLVLDRRSRGMMILDPVAAAIWERCDGRGPVEGIASEVAAALGHSRGATEADVARTVRSFASAGLVDLESVAAGTDSHRN